MEYNFGIRIRMGVEFGVGEDFTGQLRPGLGSWRGEVLRLTSFS